MAQLDQGHEAIDRSKEDSVKLARILRSWVLTKSSDAKEILRGEIREKGEKTLIRYRMLTSSFSTQETFSNC